MRLSHEKLVNIQGGHHVGTNIHGWQPLPEACHLCTEISKRRTIMQATVYPLQVSKNDDEECCFLK